MGVYGPDEESELEPSATLEESPTAVWGRYLGWHVRKQLAFGKLISDEAMSVAHFVFLDMWWLALALFLICIIEVITFRGLGKTIFLMLFSEVQFKISENPGSTYLRLVCHLFIIYNHPAADFL